MGTTLEADYNDDEFPLNLVVDLQNVGGVPGLTPTVAVRLFPSLTLYLDWSDLTFKAAGWVLQNLPMTDCGGGFYQAVLNVEGLGFTPLTGLPQKLIAQYTTTGAGTGGVDEDIVIVSELRPDAKISRQIATNRLEALGGFPGTLTLYQDDGVTVQSVQPLLDYSGGAVVNTSGTPAKRGAV
jgi:hypothetical protein